MASGPPVETRRSRGVLVGVAVLVVVLLVAVVLLTSGVGRGGKAQALGGLLVAVAIGLSLWWNRVRRVTRSA